MGRGHNENDQVVIMKMTDPAAFYILKRFIEGFCGGIGQFPSGSGWLQLFISLDFAARFRAPNFPGPPHGTVNHLHANLLSTAKRTHPAPYLQRKPTSLKWQQRRALYRILKIGEPRSPPRLRPNTGVIALSASTKIAIKIETEIESILPPLATWNGRLMI
ncbi:hypothetical protein TIFTF001_036187 [Ficus carica]|uniref:Uncharacterized protein n=1 Tax=Ficus carica TaxID=3494 RepID=A0AA88JCI1_FICCA|nr:hypothetical protein TIFTF001_036187 [Ficus carica]